MPTNEELEEFLKPSPDLRPELAKAQERVKHLELECSGMGKVLSSGIVIKSEEYSSLIDERDQARAELARMRDALRQSESAIRSVKHKVWTTEMHRAMLAIAQALAESQFCHSETGPLKNTELGSPGEKGREG